MNLDLLEKLPDPAQEAARATSVAALEYLQSTDWMALRQLETGKPIPEDVAAKRAEARLVIDAQ
ncbi:hypothetical protein GV818_33565 [Pseudomonas sp. Fl4BN1]|nr:hypothetical protein [Pseudomonas sp. Fl4BN1]